MKTIPAGTAILTYWYRNSVVSWPYSATLQVRVDGTTVKTHTEASTASGSYTQQTVDLVELCERRQPHHLVQLQQLLDGHQPDAPR